MDAQPAEVTLEITPKQRVELINVSRLVEARLGDAWHQFPRALYCSYHTTAGYLDPRISARLRHEPESVRTFLGSFRKLFPPEADYLHDQLELRQELSPEQRSVEPRNADSHLTYIGSGLESCVSYPNEPERPAYLVELDGVNGNEHRHRRTTVVGYHDDVTVNEMALTIPFSNHPIDSINLKSDHLGVFAQLQEEVRRLGIREGWIELSLAHDEQHAGLTVNEYETLLMRHDLVEVLQYPMRFMAEKGRNMLRDPRAVPAKARNYAKYDLVRAINEALDVLGLSESLVERIIDKLLAMPASRFLRMKRRVRLLVLDGAARGHGAIVHGQYQSPILVQWSRAPRGHRQLDVRFVRLK